MSELTRYQIIYTKEAVDDLMEKARYIVLTFHDSELAETWYTRLRQEIQENLTTFPLKFSLYNVEPWAERGVRLYISRNDVVLYSVAQQTVYIRGVCTKGQDLSNHLRNQK